MRILSFGVNNFRWISGGIQNNRIIFDDSNTIFIFGQNNVWKSTFLKAYEFFYKSKDPTEEDIFRKRGDESIEFEMELSLDENDFLKIQSVAPNKIDNLKKYLKDGFLLKIRREFGRKQEKEKTTFLKVKNVTWNWNDWIWEDTCYWWIGLDTVFQSCLPTPIFIQAMPSEIEVENIINTILSDKAERSLKSTELKELKTAQDKLKELQDKMYNPQAVENYKREVNSHFSKLFPDTEIHFSDKDNMAWTPAKLGKKFEIHFQKKDADGEIDGAIPNSYKQIGHGAIRSAIFSLLLMRDIADEFERKQNRKDYLVLFEEPELFLHPKLMRELRTLIYAVSEDDYPYQVLCASHSPQMIDISKTKSSLIRMIRDNDGTKIFQIDDEYLKDAKNIKTKEELKSEMYEVLRFNPFICESFYSDEVILIEWPTEEIILRWYLWEKWSRKDIFIVNCGTVNNIPFYQKIFSKFSIKYNIICDTDNASFDWVDENGVKKFTSWIQKTIYDQYRIDKDLWIALKFFYHEDTFEPAHNTEVIPEELRLKPEEYIVSNWKPYNANLYWKNILSKNLNNPDIQKVPIISFAKSILS